MPRRARSVPPNARPCAGVLLRLALGRPRRIGSTMSVGPLSRRKFMLAAAGSVAGVVATSGSHQARALDVSSSSGGSSADLVLFGGQVLLMDRRFTVAEAVAIRHGVVVATGESSQMRRWIGRRTTVVDLRGRT